MTTTKICPACNWTFTRRKKNCCPHCAEPLHFPKGRLKGQVLTQAEKEAADHLINLLRDTISDRDGIEMVFDGPALNKERLVLYQIIIRSRAYLSRVSENFGWTPASFTVDLVSGIVEDWARPWIQSYIQINASVAQAAHDLYRSRKQQEQVKSNQRSTFVELSKFVQGDGYAYHPGSGAD